MASNQESTPELKMAWAGDYESLKAFVNEKLGIEGEWSSPGGERKLFKSRNVVMHWWKNKTFLSIEGNQASETKRLLMAYICDSIGEATPAVENLSKSCNCAVLSTDMEGVKLDITILEAKLNQQSNVLSLLKENIEKRSPEDVDIIKHNSEKTCASHNVNKWEFLIVLLLKFQMKIKMTPLLLLM